MTDDHNNKGLLPDLTVFVAGDSTFTGRLALVELKAGHRKWQMWAKDLQIQSYLAAELCNNPCRRYVFGLITNGNWARLYRAEVVPDSFKIKYHVCYESEDSVDNVLKCFRFLLYADIYASLGFVDHPKISCRRNDGNARSKFLLGCVLGRGESCRTYGCVNADFYRKNEEAQTSVVPTDCRVSLVVKVYVNSGGADKERAIYDVVEKNDIQGTTKKVIGAEITRCKKREKARMLIVSPRAEHFKVAHVKEQFEANDDTDDSDEGHAFDDDEEEFDEEGDEEDEEDEEEAETDEGDEVEDEDEDEDEVEDDEIDHKGEGEDDDDANDEPTVGAITPHHVGCLATALRSLHLGGVIHGDIQYQNLFRDSAAGANRALINDFGRARLVTDMTFCDFRRSMLNDWRKLENALCRPFNLDKLEMMNGHNSWDEFWSKTTRNIN